MFLRPAGKAGLPQFQLHPRYLQQTPANPALAYIKAGSDKFVMEKYHDQVAQILKSWTADKFESIQTAPEFGGSSIRPSGSKLVRRIGASIDIHESTFSGAGASVEDLRAYFREFDHLHTAELQITGIEGSPEHLKTQVRFDLVGSGQSYHREQRTGLWEMEWKDYRLLSWRPIKETCSRATSPCYADISSHAFADVPAYSSHLSHGVDYWRTVLDGACGIDIYGHNGVSVGDIDGDGFDDLYVCQPAGLPNRLFRNRGSGTFEDITEASGVGLLDNTACALFADFNNDGHQDLVVVRAAGPLLFLNEGGGKFRLKPDAFQFAAPPQGTFTGAAAADYNRDGLLDIYFCLYTFYRGADQYNYPSPYYDAENGPPNFLMRNNGDGTFHDVTSESGLDRNNTRYSFCCGWGDSNGDGWPDLYVVNDFGRKNLYRNNGDGTFHDIAPQAGTEDIGAGMSVSWLDYNNDGLPDLYVADMWAAAGLRITSPNSMARKHAMGNSLLRNNGNGAFEDTTAGAGTGMGRWSWSSDSWDFDHDGYPDLYIANGMLSAPLRDDLNSFFWRQVVSNSPERTRGSRSYEQGWNAINELIRADYTWSGYERNVFYANNRDGTFSDISGAVGLDFLEDGRAFSLADFDHDGRLEVFLKNRSAPQLQVLQNVMPGLPPSIAFRLSGKGKSNRDAIGAAVTIQTKSGKQTKWLQAGSGFLSQHTKELFFGLGDAGGSVMATVHWPSGQTQQFHDLPSNHRIWLEESAVSPLRIEPFQAQTRKSATNSERIEELPVSVETWLLSPVRAPTCSIPDLAQRGKLFLLYFFTAASPACIEDLERFNRGSSPVVAVGVEQLPALQDLARNHRLTIPILSGSDEVLGVYNTLYQYLFDRHRDLPLPTSFLIDQAGDIVKVYQGPGHTANVEIPRSVEERMTSALPFRGVTKTYEFARNYLNFGSAFFHRGFFAQAQEAFSLAVKDDPESAEAHYGLGSAYLKQDNIAEAQVSFERAAKLKASYPDTLSNAFNNLGLLCTREGRIDAAITYFQEALKDNPDYSIALLNLGNAYRQEKRWDDARQSLEHALSVSPEDAEASYSLAMVYAQADNSEKAYEYLRRALQSRPVYPEALNNLGVLYLRTRRRDDAVRTFEECIRVAPDFNQSYLNLARVYGLEGDSPKARALLLELLKRHPDDVQARHALEQVQ